MSKHLLLKIFVFFIGSSTLLLSCKKDLTTNSSDLIGQLNANKFFEIGSANSDVVNGKAYHDTTTLIPAVAIVLNGISNKDMEVVGVIDTTLAKDIIDYYQSNNLIAPANAFGLVKDGVMVYADSSVVRDSLYCILKNSHDLDSSGTYLIPVRLSSNNNDNLISNKIALFRMQYTKNQYYAQLSSTYYYLNSDPYTWIYSSLINKYMYFNLTVNRINNHPVADMIFNVTPGVSSIFAYASLKIKAGLDLQSSIINDFKTVIDTSNLINNISIMPTENVTLNTGEVLVEQGNYISSDKFVYGLKNLNSLSVDSSYLFCMTLPANTDTNYFPPDTVGYRSKIFVRIKCADLKSLNVDSNNTIITGDTIARNNWIAYSSQGYDSSYKDYDATMRPSYAIDGDVNTYWAPFASVTPASFYINMNSSHNVKGFRIFPNYSDLTRDILIAEILSSNDGVEWTSQGYYFGSVTDPNSSISNPDYKYIHFLNPVNAQYFQIKISKTTNYYNTTSIPEIIGYE